MTARPSAESIAAMSERNRTAWSKPGNSKVAKPRRNAARTQRRKASGISTVDRPSEHDEQVAVVQWFDAWAQTKGLDPHLLFAIPNGGGRGKGDAGRLKAEGVRAGIPDLFLAVPLARVTGTSSSTSAVIWGETTALFSGLFIELKRASWKPPKSGRALAHWQRQQEVHAMLRERNYNVIVAVGAEEAIRAITAYVDRAIK